MNPTAGSDVYQQHREAMIQTYLEVHGCVFGAVLVKTIDGFTFRTPDDQPLFPDLQPSHFEEAEHFRADADGQIKAYVEVEGIPQHLQRDGRLVLKS